MAPTTGQESHLGQCWEVTESDSMGPVVIQVNRLIAGRTEVWYRLGATKGDAVFEKRLEYPIGVDVE